LRAEGNFKTVVKRKYHTIEEHCNINYVLFRWCVFQKPKNQSLKFTVADNTAYAVCFEIIINFTFVRSTVRCMPNE